MAHSEKQDLWSLPRVYACFEVMVDSRFPLARTTESEFVEKPGDERNILMFPCSPIPASRKTLESPGARAPVPRASSSILS